MKPLFLAVMYLGNSAYQIGTEVKNASAGLHSALITLSRGSGATDEFVDEMTSLATPDRVPARSTLVTFATQLAAGINGKDLTKTQLKDLEYCIRAVLRGSLPNHVSVQRLKTVLMDLSITGTQLQSICRSAMAIAEEVRGPDDIRVKRPSFR